MQKLNRIILSLSLYALFSILVFFVNLYGFNVDKPFEFWSLAVVMSGVAISFGILAYNILQSEISGKKFYIVSGASALFFIALYFFMAHPEYYLNDTYLYFFHAKIFAIYRQNPYIALPVGFSQDPAFHFVQIWQLQGFNYGPLWLLISSLPVLLTQNIHAAAFLYKLISLFSYFGCGIVLYKIFEKDIKKVFLFAINPIVLFWGVADGHNDMTMLLFLLLALYFLKKTKWRWAFLFLAFAVLIKYIAILLLPVFIAYAMKNTKPIVAVKNFFVFSAVVVLFYLPCKIGVTAILADSSLLNPRLSGPLFSGAYLLANGSFLLNSGVFLFLKNTFLVIFIIGFACLFYKLIKSNLDYERVWHGIRKIFFWFFIITYWFQAWYILWIIPFLRAKKPVVFAIILSAISWYSLTFAVLSYNFSSFFGLILALLIFCPLGFGFYFLSYPQNKSQ